MNIFRFIKIKWNYLKTQAKIDGYNLVFALEWTKSINSQGKDLLSLFVKFENRIAVITNIIKNKT